MRDIYCTWCFLRRYRTISVLSLVDLVRAQKERKDTYDSRKLKNDRSGDNDGSISCAGCRWVNDANCDVWMMRIGHVFCGNLWCLS